MNSCMMKALFYWSTLLVLLPFGDASDIKFQKLDMNVYDHISSASLCNRASPTGFKNKLSTTTAVLEVASKHSPCAQNYETQPRLLFAKILDNDQLRVKSIQARMQSNNPNKFSWAKKAEIPAQSGVPLDNGAYVVTIGLGTPQQNFTLTFDTSSDLTWTQCEPCGEQNCYQQNDTIFNPLDSTTYSTISCESKNCPNTTFGCYDGSTCLYNVPYGDHSYTKGFLSKEKFTVTPNDVFADFLFGCGHNTSGTFGKTDGILGLSRGPLSFVSQTAQNYGKYFSYCLPKAINSTGFLAFGKKNKPTKQKMISTPFVRPPPHGLTIYYFIEITGISVGRTRLDISGSVFKNNGTIIDSGTIITRLPPVAYNAMSNEFKKQMNEFPYYTSAPAYQILDTCFNISPNTSKPKVPTVSFTFKGNATVDLDASGTLYPINSTYACLAFMGNNGPSDLVIFGNTQQRAFEVAYDVAGGKLGFIPNRNCY